jgi:hypothetical protein
MTNEEKEAEKSYIEKHYPVVQDPSIKGLWVTSAVALQLSKDYHIEEYIRALIEMAPDTRATQFMVRNEPTTTQSRPASAASTPRLQNELPRRSRRSVSPVKKAAKDKADTAEKAVDKATAKGKQVADQATAKGKDLADTAVSKGKQVVDKATPKAKELADKATTNTKQVAEKAAGKGKEAVEKTTTKGKEAVEKGVLLTRRVRGLHPPLDHRNTRLSRRKRHFIKCKRDLNRSSIPLKLA